MVALGKIDLDTLPPDDAALIAHFGDDEATQFLWRQATIKVERIAGLFVRRYSWISHEDLCQEALIVFPKILARYNPAKGTSWDKYLYFSVYRACQDALRREDPLGVRIPQKSRYPSWRRLSEISESNALLEGIVLDGINKIDRGEIFSYDSSDENYDQFRQAKPPSEYHDMVYHGSKPKD